MANKLYEPIPQYGSFLLYGERVYGQCFYRYGKNMYTVEVSLAPLSAEVRQKILADIPDTNYKPLTVIVEVPPDQVTIVSR